MKGFVSSQLRAFCLLLATSLIAMGALAPLTAYARQAQTRPQHVHVLKATFKEAIVPTPGAFDQLLGGIVRGSDGAFWFTEPGTNKIGRFNSTQRTFRE